MNTPMPVLTCEKLHQYRGMTYSELLNRETGTVVWLCNATGFDTEGEVKTFIDSLLSNYPLTEVDTHRGSPH